jgi:multimeric flavodoxin WrbA
MIGELDLGEDAWISLVIRHGQLVPVHGATRLAAGDEVVVLTDPERSPDLAPVFTIARPVALTPILRCPEEQAPQLLRFTPGMVPLPAGLVAATRTRGRQANDHAWTCPRLACGAQPRGTVGRVALGFGTRDGNDPGGGAVTQVDAAAEAWRFDELRALFVNCTLKRSPERSHTQGLIDLSRAIMEQHGVVVSVLRAIDHDIATGVWPDMTEHGWERDAWPAIYQQVLDADILMLCGPIWLGDNSSVMKRVIERLYACSHLLNQAGQYAYYGRVGGCLITGNEDGVKHCAMNVLYSLQHLGYTIPPQADAGWIGEAGPGPSYLDPGSGGPQNDFTNRNTTFATWNVMHLAKLLKAAGGIPAHGNQRSLWEAGCRFDFDNPDYR